MTTPLRLGFLISGAMHVAVVAAFSLAPENQIPVAEQPGPLTLQLAFFEPPRTIAASAEERVVETPPVIEEPPSEPPAVTQGRPQTEEPLPKRVVEEVRPESAPPAPHKLVQRTHRPRPVEPRRDRPEPVARPEPKQHRVAPKPAVKVASVSRPQPSAASVNVAETQHYLAALVAKIDRRKYYPAGSRRRGEEGRVVVRFVLQKGGELTDLSIVESSGSRRLDAAALRTLRRVSPFRPIPENLAREHWPITVPIAFSLRR